MLNARYDLDLSILLHRTICHDTLHTSLYGNRNWRDIFVSIPTSILQLSNRKDEPLGELSALLSFYTSVTNGFSNGRARESNIVCSSTAYCRDQFSGCQRDSKIHSSCLDRRTGRQLCYKS